MLLVIVVTQLVVALVTGLVISTAYKKLDENINTGRETSTASRSSRWRTASRSTSW